MRSVYGDCARFRNRCKTRSRRTGGGVTLTLSDIGFSPSFTGTDRKEFKTPTPLAATIKFNVSGNTEGKDISIYMFNKQFATLGLNFLIQPKRATYNDLLMAVRHNSGNWICHTGGGTAAVTKSEYEVSLSYAITENADGSATLNATLAIDGKVLSVPETNLSAAMWAEFKPYNGVLLHEVGGFYLNSVKLASPAVANEYTLTDFAGAFGSADTQKSNAAATCGKMPEGALVNPGDEATFVFAVSEYDQTLDGNANVAPLNLYLFNAYNWEDGTGFGTTGLHLQFYPYRQGANDAALYVYKDYSGSINANVSWANAAGGAPGVFINDAKEHLVSFYVKFNSENAGDANFTVIVKIDDVQAVFYTFTVTAPNWSVLKNQRSVLLHESKCFYKNAWTYVTFKGNGATDFNDVRIKTYDGKVGEDLVPAAPVKINQTGEDYKYVFEKWADKSGAEFVPDTAYNKNVSFYAQFSETLNLISGVQMRTNEVYGIRWGAGIKTAEYEALVAKYGADKVSVGILIAPYDYVTDAGGEFTVAALEANGKTYKKVDFGGGFNTALTADNDGYSCWYGSLVNIREGNIDRRFAGRGYLQIETDAGTVIYYSAFSEADNVRSYYDVCGKAYKDIADETVKAFVKGTLDKVVNLTVAEGNVSSVAIEGYISPYSFALAENVISITLTAADAGDLANVKHVYVNGVKKAFTLSNGVISVNNA